MPRTDGDAAVASGGSTARSDWRLADWLAWQEQLNPRSIELGLTRSRLVAERLGLLSAPCITATITGTNGKGSSATLAAGIWQAAGYRVGRYLSPHLLRYNERIAIDGIEASDDAICAAFAAIDGARGDLPLTYFEFGTLAALWLFREAGCTVQVLEVGLGGRLDAVNIVDADAALVTNIGLDHTDWLGPDRDSIGREKAGIYRAGRAAICAEHEPPASVEAEARRIGARWIAAGRQFDVVRSDAAWSWKGEGAEYRELPLPALPGAFQIDNAAGVLALIEALQGRLPVGRSAIEAGLRGLVLPGRYQRHDGLILDVAHNLESATVLAAQLRAEPCAGRTWLVLGMLADKPVAEACRVLASVVDAVWCARLPPPRGLDDDQLATIARRSGLVAHAAGTVRDAISAARAAAEPGDRIVVCGSFLTVAAALENSR
ncbi:bifunctional tetrahydrofolate synthase/dihydrofolate synthase [Nevskia ramosa]|uniref:bifunctional tetrahydrofolate synthase/dihydrofolate synthase n=1 Tax=Nevskia ramosa TaxID=64002 RepID=UPI0003B56B15|nr:bifunctional tetrahydrofolate synthase/dihydrofolate synthase [Nevskia ramosa]